MFSHQKLSVIGRGRVSIPIEHQAERALATGKPGLRVNEVVATAVLRYSNGEDYGEDQDDDGGHTCEASTGCVDCGSDGAIRHSGRECAVHHHLALAARNVRLDSQTPQRALGIEPSIWLDRRWQNVVQLGVLVLHGR